MNDKELLELAAKAAELKSCGYNRMGGLSIAYDDGSGELGVYTNWNPLTDDGDALRLAVKLGMLGDTDKFFGLVENNYALGKWNSSDPYAATRRAIVRAAAEIGREMK